MWNLQPYQVHFLYFITLKSTGISCTLKKIFYPCIILLIFCSVFWSFGKDKFTELGRSPECWHISLHNIKKKITFINITIHLIRRVFKIRKWSSSWWWIHTFKKSNFHSKAWIISLVTIIVSCFTWIDTLVGEHIVAKYPTLTIVAPLCKKGVHKKKKS